MEDSSATEKNEYAKEIENSKLLALPVKTENESSTFDFSKNSWMSDFVLIVEGTRFYVAKIILALASPVFERMFQSEFKESSTNELELPGKGKDDVLEFLRCVYPDAPANLTRETALRILPLTEEYQVLKLKKRCEKTLMESIDATTSALELFQVLQQACFIELKNLRKKCVELVSEKSMAEIEEAKQEYQVPAEVMIGILENTNEKLNMKNMEFEKIMKRQWEENKKLQNEEAITEEKLEGIQQYVETETKISMANDKYLNGELNWRSAQVVLIANLKCKGVAAEEEIMIWNNRITVAAHISDNLLIRIENKGIKAICSFSVNAILVCRQPKGKNEKIRFCCSFNCVSQRICKEIKRVNVIKEAEYGFVRHDKICLIIHLYMSEPNI